MDNKHKDLTRRDFIRGTAFVTVGASMLGPKKTFSSTTEKAKRSSVVTLVRDQKVMDTAKNIDTDTLKKMMDEMIMKVTGAKTSKDAWLTLIKPQDKIGLVPTDHLNPTHDELVDAIKASLIDAGVPKKNILIAQGGSDKPKACTVLIALPALKAHWLTGIGTVLKDYIMFSDNPSRYHHEDNTLLGEIWNFPYVKGKTRLVLVDALYPLCDKGPQPDPRYKWAYKGLIAGTDPVAVETICLKIITEKRKALKGESWPLTPPPLCIEAADKTYSLGTSRMDEIKTEVYGWEKDLLLD